MKVLLVANQYIDICKDGCYSDSALFGTIENMHTLGELYIIAGKLTPEKPSALPIVQKLEFLHPDHVEFFRPTNRSISGYFKNGKYNRQLLERIIPQMDLVVGYAPSSNADRALRIAHRNKIPFLTFLVSCTWDALHNHHRLLARLLAPISFFTTRYTVKHSDYVHYVTKEFLQHRYPTNGKALGCSDTNLGEINPKVLELRLHKITTRKDKDKIRLVTTANIDVRYKGQEYVIRAIAQLKKQGDMRYHYELIGGGKGGYLRNLCKQLEVESQVSFLGRKTSGEVMAILMDADIYLQPSLQEGLPRSVVEAMSVALPCIGFNTGGIPELLEPGFVVAQKDVDGIVRYLAELQNTAKYCQTAERNFCMVGNYEHSKLVEQIRGFFAEIREEVESKLKRVKIRKHDSI